MVDALALGASGATHGGSSPLSSTLHTNDVLPRIVTVWDSVTTGTYGGSSPLSSTLHTNNVLPGIVKRNA